MGRILIKLGENDKTLVRLIVLEFHKNRFNVDVVMASFLFFKFILGKQLCSKGNNSVQRETMMLRQTVTQATAIFL